MRARCEAREGQLFFSLSAITAPAAGAGGGARRGGAGGGVAVSCGDEFDFVIGVDGRTGKPNAQKLRPLPKGSVKFETVQRREA